MIKWNDDFIFFFLIKSFKFDVTRFMINCYNKDNRWMYSFIISIRIIYIFHCSALNKTFFLHNVKYATPKINIIF